MPSRDAKKYTPTPAGKRVREARLAAGFLEQTELAAAAGVVPLTINRIEMGRGPLSRATARKLAPVLRRTEAWLLYGAEGVDGSPRGEKVPKAVEQYLTSSGWGADASDAVANLLKSLDYASIGVPAPTVRDVHRVREMIEINLATARQRRR